MQIIDVWEDKIDQKLNSFHDSTVSVKNRRGIDKIFKMCNRSFAILHVTVKNIESIEHLRLVKWFRLNENFIFIFISTRKDSGTPIFSLDYWTQDEFSLFVLP